MIDAHEKGFNQLHQIGDGLYSFVTEFKFDGKFPLQNRSLLIHAPANSQRKGTLITINPASLEPGLITQIKDLSQKLNAELAMLLSPGDWHYLFMGDHLSTFPGAKAYVPPGRIPSKKPPFAFEIFHPQETLKAFHDVLECKLVEGLKDFPSKDQPDLVVPRYEYAFYHKPTQVLIAGDVVWYERFQLKPHQQALGIPLDTLSFHFGKAQIVADAKALKESFASIGCWPFRHFASIHGDPGNILLDKAHEQWAQVLHWL